MAGMQAAAWQGCWRQRGRDAGSSLAGMLEAASDPVARQAAEMGVIAKAAAVRKSEPLSLPLSG